MTVDYKRVGLIIKQARLKIRLSQEELAFRCNLTREYVSLIENGHKHPSLDTLLILTDKLNLNLQEILDYSPYCNQLFDYELITMLKTSSEIEKNLYLKIICLVKETLYKITQK